jgi:2-keto-4-pentenoate hydratase/2-oxohepta-3-ene-1,7-dioic acid hydratase in catechol pathway
VGGYSTDHISIACALLSADFPARSGGGNSREMHHKFPDILSFISNSETQHPGEAIASGTVPTGRGLELGRFLNPNDAVELEIERIGMLRNRIVRDSC